MTQWIFWNLNRFQKFNGKKSEIFLLSLIVLGILALSPVSALDTQLLSGTPYATGNNPDQYLNSLCLQQSTILNSKTGTYLAEVMDQYHTTFNVYTDADAAGNHFSARGAIAEIDDTKVPYMNENYIINPHSGTSSIECSFSPQAGSWSGWYFLNGYLTGTATKPGLNWGDLPDAGVDLSGSSSLTFWARGSKGGEKVEFFAFGTGYDMNKPYKDSSNKVSTGVVTLSTTWTRYSLDIRGRNLSYVLGGFGWVATAPNNQNQNITFYLDDIQYDKTRLADPRFLVSYTTINSSYDFDTILRNTAFSYDNAIALLAFIADNDIPRARLIADAFVYAQNHDRYFGDGRIRNSYMGGDLVVANGWTPNGRSNTVRIPGFYNPVTKEWNEDKFQVSTHTGNVAWAMIALLTLYENTGGDQYLSAAEKMGDWIENNCYNSTGIAGYTGGLEGYDQSQFPLTYKSTEHNIDIYVAFKKLYRATNNSTWNLRAGKAKGFLNAMWDSSEGKFWIGTLPDGSTINTIPVVLDIQAWSNLADDGNEIQYRPAITYSNLHLFVGNGFDFNDDRDGTWNEGTAQMAVAYKATGSTAQWERAVTYLKSNQSLDGGIFASDKDGLTTGLDVTSGTPWLYYHRLHVGATGWMVFAETGRNPYWLGINRTTNIGIFRNATGFWYLDYNLDGSIDKSFRYGGSSDQIVKGDWDGDGKDGIAIFRPSTGYWYFDYNLDGVVNKSIRFGGSTDRIIVGKWQGTNDGMAIFRPSTGTWYFDYNLDGSIDKSFRYGGSSDQIVVGDWDGDGKDGIAIFRPSIGYWYFDYNLDGIVNKSFRYGGSTDRIVVGKWA